MCSRLVPVWRRHEIHRTTLDCPGAYNTSSSTARLRHTTTVSPVRSEDTHPSQRRYAGLLLHTWINVLTRCHLVDATGPFLDSYLCQTVGQIKKAVGQTAPSCDVPRNSVHSSQRVEEKLRVVSECLRQMAALALSSRSMQKQRAEEGSDIGRYVLKPSPSCRCPNAPNMVLVCTPTPLNNQAVLFAVFLYCFPS